MALEVLVPNAQCLQATLEADMPVQRQLLTGALNQPSLHHPSALYQATAPRLSSLVYQKMSMNQWSESVFRPNAFSCQSQVGSCFIKKDLFTQTVGRIKTLSMAYDSRGKPTGTATIEFVRAGDGAKAYADYNGRLIDQSSW